MPDPRARLAKIRRALSPAEWARFGGMVAAVVIVEAFADHFAVLNEDRADDGIRMREGGSASC